MATIKLNEATLAKLPAPTDVAQAYYWDREVRGFGVVVGRTGRKTFVARGRVGGELVKRTIGTAGAPRDEDGHVWNTQLAKAAAKQLLGTLASGKAPPTTKAKARSLGPTLQEALDFHVGKMERGENRRGKVCSTRSVLTLRNCVELHLADHLERPLVDLTADELDNVRRSIERNAERVEGSNLANPPGRAVANRLIANVSAIWRSYHRRYGLPVSNPTERLIAGALKPRDNRIANDALPDWHAKVLSMENHVRRDLQLVALFTGVRTDGVRSLTWDDIDFDKELIQIARAKGDRPYTLPMVDTVRKILEARQKENATAFAKYGGDGGFVFPSFAIDGKTVIAIAEVKERRNVLDARGKPKRTEDGGYLRETYLPGIQATRKTFNSVAIEIGVPAEAREALMNHEGRGVNVKSYGFPQNWDYLRSCADQVETALWQRLKAKRRAREREKISR